MRRLPVNMGGVSSQQTTTANSVTAHQTVQSIAASRETPFGTGSLMDFTAHKSAVPSLAFVLLGGGLLFWLIYRSHLSLSASLGRG